MRGRTIAVVGVIAYALFLAAGIPASFIAARVSAASAGRINVTDAEGTIWHGSAKARVIAPGAPLFVDNVEWRFLPARLAAARLAYALRASAPGLEASAEVARGFAEWEARDTTARVEGAVIAALSPAAAALHPEGVMTASVPAIRWTESTVNGNGALEWRNAAVSLSEVHPLGSYRAEAIGEDGAVKFTVSTVDGALRVSGRGELTLPSRVSFSGEARGEGPQAALLDPLLDLIGPKRADGARAIELRTNIRR